MAYEVKIYFNTGFNANNRPATPAILQTATMLEFDEVRLNQNSDISVLRITTDWNTIKNADYAQIGDRFFIITSVTMAMENVAELILSIDVIASIGINNMTFVGGWTKRRNLTSAEQSLSNYGKSIIPEPWQPTNPLIMDFQDDLLPAANVPVYVLTTADLTQLSDVAQTYVSESLSVAVPKLPPATKDIVFEMNLPNGEQVKYSLEGISAYRYSIDYVKTAINELRQLGVESAIMGSYALFYPEVLQEVGTTSDGKEYITKIFSRSGTAPSTLNYAYNDTVENKKIFALYNAYVVINKGNGASMAYTLSDIYDGKTAPEFYYWCDPSPQGGGYIRPVSYKGNTDNIWVGALKGAPWLNNQFTFESASGGLVVRRNAEISNSIAYNQNLITNEGIQNQGNMSYANTILNGYNAGLSLSAPMSSTVKDPQEALAQRGLGAFGSLANSGVNYANAYASQELALQSAQQAYSNAVMGANRNANDINNRYAPQVVFPIGNSIQAYFGNNFILCRYRLTDNDVQRLDTFLHRYGEAVDEPFARSHITNKQSFNYIQTSEINIKSPAGLRYNEMAENIFNMGVRLWHTLPNQTALNVGGNADV